MPSTVTSTIGTSSRNYSTIQAWEDACPANLVTSDQIWKGECYNDSEFLVTSGSLLTISGITTDSTRYLFLTAATGQSFQDHANVRTNPLRYNQSNGVGLRTSTGSQYSGLVIYSPTHNTLITRLQLKSETNETIATDPYRIHIRDCIIETTGNATWTTCVGNTSNLTTIYNTVCFKKSNGLIIKNYDGITIIGCTLIQDSATTSTTEAIASSNGTLINTLIIGWNSVYTGTWTGSNNGWSGASGLPGTSNVYNIPLSTVVEDTLATGWDGRTVSGAANSLGIYDGTNSPNDISKTTRINPPTIGAWEVISASTTPRISQLTTELISQNLIVPDPRISQLAVEALILRRDLTPTLVGHWPMNEASGPAIDVHGDNDLTLFGTVDHGQDPIDGTPARHLTQTDKNYFKHVDNSDLRLGANEGFTWITRFKLNSSGFDFFIVNKSLPPAGYSILWVGTLGFNISFDNGYENATSVTAAGVGNDWTDLSGNFGQTFVVAAGYNSATRKLWIRVNKETRVEANWTANTILKNQTDLFVGADHDDLVNPQESLDGAIGPVSFFKGNLTDSEIDYWIDNKGNYSEIGGDIATITDPHISQQAIEVITSLTAASTDPRISQLAVELITLIPQPRISQLVTELISLATPDSRISQLAIELISLTVTDPRVSQLTIELITLITEVRISQLAIELISLPTPLLRISQLAVEMMSLQPIVFTEKTEFFIVAG